MPNHSLGKNEPTNTTNCPQSAGSWPSLSSSTFESVNPSSGFGFYLGSAYYGTEWVDESQETGYGAHIDPLG